MSLSYAITGHRTRANAHRLTAAKQAGTRLINLPRRDGRLSWLRWLGAYRDGLPVSSQSPIQIVTVPSVDNYVHRDQCVTTTPRRGTGMHCLRAVSSTVRTSRWPPSGGRAGLQLFTLTKQTKNQKSLIHTVLSHVLTIYNTTVLVVQRFGVGLVIERSLVRPRPGRYQVN